MLSGAVSVLRLLPTVKWPVELPSSTVMKSSLSATIRSGKPSRFMSALATPIGRLPGKYGVEVKLTANDTAVNNKLTQREKRKRAFIQTAPGGLAWGTAAQLVAGAARVVVRCVAQPPRLCEFLCWYDFRMRARSARLIFTSGLLIALTSC